MKERFINWLVGALGGWAVASATIIGTMHENTTNITHLQENQKRIEITFENRVGYIVGIMEKQSDQNKELIGLVRLAVEQQRAKTQ